MSDVAIVLVGLALALMWMQGLIGWAIILGQRFGTEVIFRSQFSNLLPILVLALGIDDSLHALTGTRRRGGRGPAPSRGPPNLREQSRSGHPAHIHDDYRRFHGQHDLQHCCPALIRHRGRPRGVLRLRPHRPLGPPGALRLRPVVGIEGQVAGRGGWDHPHGAQAVVGCSHHEFSQTRPSRGRTGHPNPPRWRCR
ncbi:MAG: hypothetical protein Ct9H300mP10_09820 [Methanobacteriota archaeon]|nr:MAG: hypothetical protein Ct9H300mP10_09820 [Euryarchaeota archaeon]